MEYSKDHTLSHPLAKTFAKPVNELAQQDGGKGLFPASASAISLDAVEKSRKSPSASHTMDMVMGICEHRHDKECNQQMLLCEFRFNYKNPSNTTQANIEAKITHSEELLNETTATRIHENKYFLLNFRKYLKTLYSLECQSGKSAFASAVSPKAKSLFSAKPPLVGFPSDRYRKPQAFFTGAH